MSTSADLLFPLALIFIVILFIVWASNKYTDKKAADRVKWDYLLPVIYLMGAVAAIGVLIFPAMRPARTWFISICLIMIVISFMFTEINFEAIGKHTPKAAFIALVLICTVSYTVVFGDLHDTYTQTREQAEIINSVRTEDNGRATIKIVKPSKSKHDYMTYVNDFSTNEKEWQNQWASLYYRIEGIIGKD